MTQEKYDNEVYTDYAEVFKSLFHTYYQPLVYFSFRFVRDKHIAEDIVQEVFVNVWNTRKKLDFTENMKTYLYTAVKNLSLKHLRHSRVKRRGNEQIQIRLNRVAMPDEVLDFKELENAVEQTIRELPEKCQQIFSMNRFDGLTYTQIAEIQNISVKTVETHMSRALQYLRKRMAHFFNLP